MKILHLNFHQMSFHPPIPLRAVKFWTLCDIQSSTQRCCAVCLWRMSSSDSRFYLFLAPVFTWKQELCVICTVPLLNKQWGRSRFYTSLRTKHLRWKEKSQLSTFITAVTLPQALSLTVYTPWQLRSEESNLSSSTASGWKIIQSVLVFSFFFCRPDSSNCGEDVVCL